MSTDSNNEGKNYLCLTQEGLPQTVTYVIGCCHIFIFLCVSCWSLKAVKKVENVDSSQTSCFTKISFYLQDLWLKRRMVVPM